MSCISFIDERSNERLYDSYMLRERLRMTKSKLQKELSKYNFTSEDYVIYKNQFLFKESSVVRFIESVVLKRYLLNKRKFTDDRLKQIRQSIKDYIRTNELREN
jgi:hypothetical protein